MDKMNKDTDNEMYHILFIYYLPVKQRMPSSFCTTTMLRRRALLHPYLGFSRHLCQPRHFPGNEKRTTLPVCYLLSGKGRKIRWEESSPPRKSHLCLDSMSMNRTCSVSMQSGQGEVLGRIPNLSRPSSLTLHRLRSRRSERV